MFPRLKQPICCSHLWALQRVALLWIGDDFLTEKRSRCCVLHRLHAAALLNLILNFLFHFRGYIAEWIHLKNPARTRLDHPEIPQNCKSSQLCSPSSCAQCSVEILSSLSAEAMLEVCSWARLEAAEFLNIANVCSLKATCFILNVWHSNHPAQIIHAGNAKLTLREKLPSHLLFSRQTVQVKRVKPTKSLRRVWKSSCNLQETSFYTCTHIGWEHERLILAILVTVCDPFVHI